MGGAIASGALMTIGLALYYRHVVAVHEHGRGQGFPMDDAWIHAQFALSFARGHPFQYNVGTYSSGSTSPLWSLIEGLGLLFFDDPVAVAHTLGVVFSILHLAMAVLVARRLGLGGPWLLAVPVLLLSQWRLAWAAVSGMEVPLVCFLVLATFWLYLKERTGSCIAWRTGLVAGALLWSRPEGLVAIFVILLDQLLLLFWNRPNEDVGRRRRIGRIAGLLGGFVALALPFFALNAATGPGIFPQTLYTKAHVMTAGRGWYQLWMFFVDLMGGDASMQVFYFLAAYSMIRFVLEVREGFPRATLVLFVLGWLGGVAYLRGSGDYFSRYIIPCIGILSLLGAYGLWRACRALRFGVVGLVVGIAALLYQSVPVLERNAADYAMNVVSVSGHVVRMGQWADRHVPPDAVIAMSDVGGMSYYTENRVVDMRGLVSSYHGWDRLAEVDRQRREDVSWAFLFPELNERVILRGGYVPIHVISLDANNISATDNLVVYRAPWADTRRLVEVGRAFDFEDATYQGWTTSGVLREGLADGPRHGQRHTVNLGGGRWFLNSFGPEGDHSQGRAISPPFTIEGDVMTLRVGGGELPGLVGARLWVDGRIVRTAVGARSEVLVQREWDLRDLRGRRGRIEMYDNSSEGWAHVLLDEIHQYRVEGGSPPELVDFEPGGPRESTESRHAAEEDGLEL